MDEINTDSMIAEAELGEQARAFIESDLGRYMLGLADQEVVFAQEALEKVDPTDSDEIRRIQNQAWLGRRFKEWLFDIMDKGESALLAWKQENDK